MFGVWLLCTMYSRWVVGGPNHNAVIMWKHLYCVVYFTYIFFLIFQLFLKPTKGHSGQADWSIGCYKLYASYVLQVELNSYTSLSQLWYCLLCLCNSVELHRTMNKRNVTGVTREVRTVFALPSFFALFLLCCLSDVRFLITLWYI